MGFRFERQGLNPDRPGTYHVKFTVTCDGDHGLFPAPQIEGHDDYVEFRGKISDLGWVERSSGLNIFHCPECVKNGETNRIC